MVTKKLLKSICIAILVTMMTVLLSSTKCSHELSEVRFKVRNETNDTVYFEYVDYNGNKQAFSLPYFSDPSSSPNYTYNLHRLEYDELERYNDISWVEAMQILKNNIDSVRIYRTSDTKVLFYSHGENVTEQEKFFFTQNGWKIKNEFYNSTGNLVQRDYIFSITDILFE